MTDLPVTLRLGYLYPDLLNLYGDRGNIIALTQRAQWRGIHVVIQQIGLGERPDFRSIDLAFIGGGQDREQCLIADDLVATKGDALRDEVEDGLPIFAVCGGYQLLGHYYRTGDGRKLPGAGILDIWTEAGKRRMIGNVVVKTDLWNEDPHTIVGFENHSGRTFLGEGCRPLGRVQIGGGNNGEDGGEGTIYRHVIGTYLHGPGLPKNPRMTDWLLERAIERRYGEHSLQPLSDTLEMRAHQAAIKRALQRKGAGGHK